MCPVVSCFKWCFMFVVFDSVVDCSHHSLPSPLLPPPGLSSLQKRPLGNGNGKSFKDFLRVTNKNHRLVCGKKCPISQILPERKLWKCLQRSKTWSALIFDDQLLFPSFCLFIQCFSRTFCNPSYEQRFQFNQNNSFWMMIFSSQFIEGNNVMNGSWSSQGQCQHSWEKTHKIFLSFWPFCLLVLLYFVVLSLCVYQICFSFSEVSLQIFKNLRLGKEE